MKKDRQIYGRPERQRWSDKKNPRGREGEQPIDLLDIVELVLQDIGMDEFHSNEM